MYSFVLHFVLYFVILLIVVAAGIAAVLCFNAKTRSKAKALVLSELAVIRAADAKTEADLKAKAARSRIVPLNPGDFGAHQ